MNLAQSLKYHRPTKWEDLPYGKQSYEVINQQIQPWVTRIYGSHLLKIGELTASLDTRCCKTRHQVTLASGLEKVDLRALPEQLPILSKSIDACVMTHVLGWSSHPHRVLREVDRVLVEDGWLILSEINPFSLLAMGRFLPLGSLCFLRNSQLFSQTRLIDWLHLFNYEIQLRQHRQLFPWQGVEGRWPAKKCVFVGGVNLIVARKRTYPLTLERKKMTTQGNRLQPAVNATQQIHVCPYHEEEE